MSPGKFCLLNWMVQRNRLQWNWHVLIKDDDDDDDDDDDWVKNMLLSRLTEQDIEVQR